MAEKCYALQLFEAVENRCIVVVNKYVVDDHSGVNDYDRNLTISAWGLTSFMLAHRVVFEVCV